MIKKSTQKQILKIILDSGFVFERSVNEVTPPQKFLWEIAPLHR